MKKCVIWGIGKEYDGIINQISYEIYKGNMTVEALVCRKEDKYCSFKDGFKIVAKEEIATMKFDYLIIASSYYFDEIKREAFEYGILPEKIIDGKVFRLPLFDFELYSELISNPVTILSDDCWGGLVYNYLGLKFSTPLINTYWNRGEYSRFIQNPRFYLQTELTMVKEGDLKLGEIPIGKLGDEENFVQIEFVHNTNFEEAKGQWDRRKKRINFNNIIVKMGFSNVEKNKKFYLDSFEKCKYRKILFYDGNEDVENVIKSDRFIWEPARIGYVRSFNYNDFMLHQYPNVIDIFKLLVGKKEYLREV